MGTAAVFLSVNGVSKNTRELHKKLLDDLTTLQYNNRLPCECNLMGNCHAIGTFPKAIRSDRNAKTN